MNFFFTKFKAQRDSLHLFIFFQSITSLYFFSEHIPNWVGINHEMSQDDITKRNKAIIHKNWGMIKQQLNIADVIDPLIEAGVAEIDRWVEIRKIKSEIEKVEELLLILTKKPWSIPIFHKALKSRNASLAVDLQIDEDSCSAGEENHHASSRFFLLSALKEFPETLT